MYLSLPPDECTFLFLKWPHEVQWKWCDFGTQGNPDVITNVIFSECGVTIIPPSISQ